MPKIYKILGYNRYWDAFSFEIIPASGKYDAGLKAGVKQKAIEIAEITDLTIDEIQKN